MGIIPAAAVTAHDRQELLAAVRGLQRQRERFHRGATVVWLVVVLGLLAGGISYLLARRDLGALPNTVGWIILAVIAGT